MAYSEALEYWQNRAQTYGRTDWANRRGLMDLFLAECHPERDMVVLDLGTGTGIVASALAPSVHMVVGVDISADMLAMAGDLRANVSVRIMDAQALGFADCVFDLVTARMVLHHVTDVSRALSEVYRCLKPGCRLVVCEGVPPDHTVIERYTRIFELKEERHTFTEAGLVNLMDRAGFEAILLRAHFMRRVSLMKWLRDSQVAPESAHEIRRLHVEADENFKSLYRMEMVDGDCLMDWKFVVVSGKKPAVSGD